MPVDARETARKLVSDWRELFGPRLRAALLFGSVARGEAVEGVSNINVLVLLDTIDARTLKQASASTRTWLKTAFAPPLLFEADQWLRAADVFSIEIADMRDAHEMLYGNDPLSACVIDERAMRVQAERELRGKLLHLQSSLLAAADTPADVGELLLHGLPAFATYMRAALRLSGQEVPKSTPEVIDRAVALFGGNGAALRMAWETRTSKRALKLAVDDPLVDAYYDTAEQLADYVDSLRR